MQWNKTRALPKCHVPYKAQNSFFGSEQLVSPHKQLYCGSWKIVRTIKYWQKYKITLQGRQKCIFNKKQTCSGSIYYIKWLNKGLIPHRNQSHLMTDRTWLRCEWSAQQHDSGGSWFISHEVSSWCVRTRGKS